MPDTLIKFPRFWRPTLVCLGFLFFAINSKAPPATGGGTRTNDSGVRITEVRNSKIDDYYPAPNGTQKKSRIEFAKAVPSPQGPTLLSDVRVQTWLLNGAPELLIDAPECSHDQKGKIVYSPGTLRVRTADGRFLIEGEGFMLFQTNSTLLISNKVHTVVHPSLINSNATAPPDSEKAIEIFSDHFQYVRDPGIGTYDSNVRASGTNLALTCGEMKVLVPLELKALQEITAARSVVMDYEMGEGGARRIHATGDQAIYYATNGHTIVTGHPTWSADQQEGRGDELLLDATNKTFRVTGNALLKISSQGAARAGFLPQQKTSLATTNLSTNQFTEVSCDQYFFQTNQASFGDHVQVRQTVDNEVTGTMTCAQMFLTFAGTNQLQTMLADKNVVIRQATNEFTAGQAFYTATNELLALTQEPKWRSGEREGKGDQILVNVQNQEMQVRTNAYMRLPANDLAQTGPPGQKSPTGVGKLTASQSTNSTFAEISSEQYLLKPGAARFDGAVRIIHPRMNWACGIMDILSDPGGATKMTAERQVDFHFNDEGGKTIHGTSGKAVYNYSVAGGVTNDLAILTGDPVLESGDGSVLKNSIIFLDRARHTLSAPGQYKLYGQAGPGGGTNLLQDLRKAITPPKR